MDIHGGSQDLCKFSFVCLHPESDIIQVWFAVLVFKFMSLIDNTSLPIGLPPILEYRREQWKCGKQSSGL